MFRLKPKSPYEKPRSRFKKRDLASQPITIYNKKNDDKIIWIMIAKVTMLSSNIESK